MKCFPLVVVILGILELTSSMPEMAKVIIDLVSFMRHVHLAGNSRLKVGG